MDNLLFTVLLSDNIIVGYILADKVCKGDARKIILYQLIVVLPHGQGEALSRACALFGVLAQTFNRCEVTLGKIEYLPKVVRIRLACELVAAAFAVQAVDKPAIFQRRQKPFDIFK